MSEPTIECVKSANEYDAETGEIIRYSFVITCPHVKYIDKAFVCDVFGGNVTYGRKCTLQEAK